MCRKIIVYMWFILFPFILWAQPNTFTTTINITHPGGVYGDSSDQIVPLEDGSFVIIGFSRYYDEVHDFVSGFSVSKIDKNGEVIWKKLHKSPNPPYSLLSASISGILPLEDGGFMVAGSNYTEYNNEDMFLMRLDNEGNELWFKRYGGSQWERGRSSGILQGIEDNILFLAGKGIYGDVPSWDMYLVNFDENGTMLWSKTYGGDDFDISGSISWDIDGGLILGGHSRSVTSDGNGDAIIMKTDAQGEVLWLKNYGTSNDDGFAIVVPSKHREGYILHTYLDTLLVEGQLEPTVSFWYGLDEQGGILWEQHFVGKQFKAPDDFVELEDGSIIIVGFDENVPQISDEENIFWIREAYGWMAKLSPYGELLWEKQFFDDRAITPVMYFRDVALTQDDGLIMTGVIWKRDSVYVEEVDSTFVVLNRDIWVVKTDLEGCLHPNCGENELIYVDIPEVENPILEGEVPVFQVFPNPARQQAQLYFPNTRLLEGKEVELEAWDMQGRLVFEQELLDKKEQSFWELEVSDWQSGMYVLRLKVEGEVLEEKRLVVE